MLIGVLALQGDYSLHVEILNKNKINNILIKDPLELSIIDGLIQVRIDVMFTIRDWRY